MDVVVERGVELGILARSGTGGPRYFYLRIVVCIDRTRRLQAELAKEPAKKKSLWRGCFFAFCRRSTILSVGNRSAKMSVYGRIDIERQGTEPVTDLERSVGALLDHAGGGPVVGSE